jgi:hypothetical protein
MQSSTHNRVPRAAEACTHTLTHTLILLHETRKRMGCRQGSSLQRSVAADGPINPWAYIKGRVYARTAGMVSFTLF